MYNEIKDSRVTIMGLGLHGGGVESALFFLKNGAKVTVTDLKHEKELSSSLEKLKNFPLRLVLGRHKKEDFISADLIIKNPGVPKTSPFIDIARKHNIPVETDPCPAVFASFPPAGRVRAWRLLSHGCCALLWGQS